VERRFGYSREVEYFTGNVPVVTKKTLRRVNNGGK